MKNHSQFSTLNSQLDKLSEAELQLLLKTARRSNRLFGQTAKDLIFYSYEFVKIKLPELLQNNELAQVVNLFFDDFSQAKTSELFSFIVWIIDQLEAIYKLEADYLQQTPDKDLINAGLSELDQFGELNVIDNLAGGDILKWEQIKKLPYHMVFDKLHKNVVEAKIQKKFIQLKIKN